MIKYILGILSIVIVVTLTSAILPIWGDGPTSYANLGITEAIKPTFTAGSDTLKLYTRRTQVHNVLVQNAVDSLTIVVMDTVNSFANQEIWVSFRAGGASRKIKFRSGRIGAPATATLVANSFVFTVGNGFVGDFRLRYYGGKYNLVQSTVTTQ